MILEELMRYRIYTDGSYDNGTNVGSWAIVIVQHNGIKVKSGIVKGTTNNQMELIAVLKSLEYAVRKCIRNVEIITDSMYVLNGIHVNLDTWVCNGWLGCRGGPIKHRSEWEGIKIMLDSMKENKFSVKFSKVKSQSGNSLNELADSEAKKAIAEYIRRM